MTIAYPETKFDVAHTFPRPKRQSPNQFALFDCMIEPESKIYLSEDFAFCRRWRQLGGKIWLDTKTRLAYSREHISLRGHPRQPDISLYNDPIWLINRLETIIRHWSLLRKRLYNGGLFSFSLK